MSGIVGDNTDDGSGVINAPTGGATVSSSNPTITTNAELGTNWANSSTGDYYICTDATTDGNVWINVDDAGGHILYYLGQSHGFTAGGGSDVIDRFAFASDGDATDWEDLIASYDLCSGNSSATNGYSIGAASADDIQQKFPFASQTAASEVGDLVSGSNSYGFASSDSATHGYLSGHKDGALTNVIQKLSFSVDGNTADVANLITTVAMAAGSQSSTYGYVSGGLPSGSVNTIQKFQFASDGDATDVANLTASLGQMKGNSAKDYGYTAGGNTGSVSNVINKFAFTSDSDATDIGNLTVARKKTASTQSSQSGYTAGGNTGSNNNTIDKYSFVTDGDATDVGNLTTTTGGAAGSQV